MVREDCGIEAKEAAVREAYKLLPLPELLASISSWIKSRYIARQQQMMHLSTMLAEQVDQTRSALEALSLSISKDHKQSSSLHGNYADIKKMSRE
ncbi:exocyst complex component SEC6-like [Papaver somniferum]|uniref:exocyst complex component SEC6-like n=1 Tax=Papaver somniferum TaxID=3469 RepID=UPI000E6F85AA|nr:exocyst complex component SEC6-like [Papaver somniferum]